MKTIAIANQKGGVGKTTTSVNMAASLTELGKKVLLIDTDQQTNSTDTFRASYEGEATLYDCWLAEDKEDINKCIQHTEIGDIIAGDPLLREAETKIARNPAAGLTSFKKMLNSLEGYDYVLIDCPPSLGSLLQAILIAADEVIIPVTADRYAVQGLSQIWETIQNVREIMNPNLKIAGFLLVRFNTRTNLNRATYEALENIAKQLDTKIFDTYIRESVKAREALVARETLTTYAPHSTTGEDYKMFVREYIGE
ncbi:MAG: AAA family ATPase [Lachnospiraceae bacterium]|nr:AAA family ATPase [Lachnospiraceae bacterium]